MNSRPYVIWARINCFKARLMEKYRDQTTQDGKFVEEFWCKKKTKQNKMASEIVQISKWVLIHRHSKSSLCKWPWILNWSKWVLLVDISTQILLTIMGSICHSGCLHNCTNQREALNSKLRSFAKFVRNESPKSEQNLIENIYN